ncbi:hypothetical protein DL95DRAFT_298857 [Leptodontidium sp. 2 PMI_412]|nr:hypothetical protein DL95DRAFT_298857 [Leptodontidium sp. 2 PMI_412]
MRRFDRLDSHESWREGLEGDGEKTTCGVNGKQEPRHNFESFRELWLVYSDGNLGKKLTPIVASACYLAAAIPPETELHHVSTTPLSPNQFPNIIPLSVPTGSPYLAYPSDMFSSIYSFGSASLLSSHAIPILLRECHRVLALPSSRAQNMTAGTLHLTIVDPCPVSATLGPRLRDWLDHHLVFDLRRNLHPVRLFPGWLAEAGLYAEGSTTTQIIFLASIANSQSLASSESDRRGDAEQMAEKEMEKENKEEEQSRENDVTQELKSILGRLLWKETWGSNVQLKGGKWWWEDNSILDECWARGTLWEYAVIDAVKG